jgi:hypothetical protein
MSSGGRIWGISLKKLGVKTQSAKKGEESPARLSRKTTRRRLSYGGQASPENKRNDGVIYTFYIFLCITIPFSHMPPPNNDRAVYLEK